LAGPSRRSKWRLWCARRSSRATPNLGSFEDVQDWTKDLDLDASRGRKEDAHAPLASDGYKAGNLAALEDDAPGVPLPRNPSVAQPRPAPAPATARLAPSSDPAPPVTRPPLRQTTKSGGSGGVIAIVVLVVVAAGAAGAYFAGFFH
jgi:hypothetical protein